MDNDFFETADRDGSGALDILEFTNAFKEKGIALSRKDARVLMTRLDRDGSGEIQVGV